MWRPLYQESLLIHRYRHLFRSARYHILVSKNSDILTCTQRTGSSWPWNLWTGDPTPSVVRCRRSNMWTELSADLNSQNVAIDENQSYTHQNNRCERTRSTYPVKMRFSSWGFQSTQCRSVSWAFSTWWDVTFHQTCLSRLSKFNPILL